MNEMRNFDKQNSQSGQALVEYLLLLVVAIALILGLMNQFYKPFGNWVKNYMGEYVECLLDVGELPTVGGGEGICPKKLAEFKRSNHRPSDLPKTTSSNSDTPLSAKAGRSGETSTSSSSSSGGGSSRRGDRGFAIGQRGGTDSAGDGSSGDQKMSEPLPQSQYMKFRSPSSSSTAGPAGAGTSNGTFSIPIVKLRDKSEGGQSIKVNVEQGDGNTSQAKKLIITPPERKTASMEDDQPWSISQYLKFALILMIIIAIVLFLGGQILQISKSMEK